jgi:hypothetical protein
VLPHGVETAILLAQRRDEVLKKEIGSGGEGYGVGNGGFETVGMDFDGVKNFENGGGRVGVKEGDERLDSGDRFGEIGIRQQKPAVCFDNAAEVLEKQRR